ncbi:hypothetical protein [Erythrobacter cryptus]|uniref:hypothetical protein n=1 Tax=Erythrobacter cryptus TaxID=196588 RepID=UPI000424E255|nr:hypothetical protein [Erythrobacter cryptus]GIX20945.1 MAG: hypothetical protein KatS3mg120_2621 [Erythrobacter sp.]
MRFLSSDLVRQFGIGFALGAVLVVGARAQDAGEGIASPAQAAERIAASGPTADFVIAPEAR